MKALRRALRNRYDLYLLLLIPLAWYILFQYVPMYGLQIAFRRFNPSLGITASPWVGTLYFRPFFNSYFFESLLVNTLVLSPYFLSIVVIVSMLDLFSDPSYGLFNKLGALLGAAPQDYITRAQYFRPLYVFSGVWQNMGFNSVIYIAALTAIDPQLYEAASIDGASRLRKIWHISLPGILPTIVILFIMRIGSLMNVGFEKVLLMQNPVNMTTSDVISTFIYRNGIQKGQFSYSAAVGIFNSLINLILLVGANALSRKVTHSSLW